ncbi:alpha/beta hydrolase [Microbacterium sp. KUDC0406]|uniref:alpha/beta fold hydrolase n=1 Tax=Microbacterium sp. KUDC0406 TaxID=2909588 RepID=UPI001F38A5F0|nr:alpha/beta hydrolase [Microbacterium sp. KUDC0406]UJP10452.1 alpha/beta hydrolase [Microbacterium sp. KUDC0406]
MNEHSEWEPPLPDAPGFEHRVLRLPGVRMHVATIGEGEPVLLLHGFPEHWWQWRRIAPELARHGYRAVCPDLRGCGWTAADAPGMDRESHLRDVIALLDELGIVRTRVISHDMGAISAMQLAYAHPERVGPMVQLSVPPGFFAFTPGIVPAFRHMPKLLVHRPPASMRYLFGPAYLTHPLTEDELSSYLVVERRPEVLASVRTIFRGLVIPESMRLAGGTYRRMRLRPPTLCVFGRDDGPFSEKNVRRITRGHERFADRIEFAYVDDAAHFLTDDAPEEVAELALEWFARTDEPTTLDAETSS